MALFSSILNTFFGIFELVQASGRMVGADTIPRPPQSYSHKNLRQCSMKYRVQNEVAAQMNSWRARRHSLIGSGNKGTLIKYLPVEREDIETCGFLH